MVTAGWGRDKGMLRTKGDVLRPQFSSPSRRRSRKRWCLNPEGATDDER